MFGLKRKKHNDALLLEKVEHLKRLLDLMTHVFVDTNQIITSKKKRLCS